MIVLGLGSPYLSDDGVGPRVVRELARRGLARDLQLAELHAGGLLLLEELEGSDRAVIVDALLAPLQPPGTVLVGGMREDARNLACSHDCSLPEALALGRVMGMSLPGDDDIRLVGIVASDVSTFSEHLTPRVEAAVDQACDAVLACLEAWESGGEA